MPYKDKNVANARVRERRATDPEYRARVAAQSKARRAKRTPERIEADKAKAAAQHLAKRDAHNAVNKAWALAHPEKMREYGRKHDPVRRAVGSTAVTHVAVLNRCTNPKQPSFKNYGAKLTPCLPDSWRGGKKGLKQMIADVGERPSPAHELHRPCPDKGYSKSNAVWSTDHSEPCAQKLAAPVASDESPSQLG